MKVFKIFFIFLFVFFVAVLWNAQAQGQNEAAVISLPEPELSLPASLMSALKERKSTREFKTEELSLQTLSNLLWAANGINRPDSGKRTAPSAKNAQEIDIYVAMKEGLYFYNAKTHALELSLAQDIRSSVGIQEFVNDAPLSLVFVADFSRLDGAEDLKNSYAWIDTGYISQNVYLFCAAEGLATVVLGWVDKESLKTIMNLAPQQQIIVTQPVGYLK